MAPAEAKTRRLGTGQLRRLPRGILELAVTGTLLQFLQLFAHHVGSERKVFAVAHHVGLSLLAEDVAQKLLRLRVHCRAGLDARIEILLVVERIGAVLDSVERVFDAGLACPGGDGQALYLGAIAPESVIGDPVAVLPP